MDPTCVSQLAPFGVSEEVMTSRKNLMDMSRCALLPHEPLTWHCENDSAVTLVQGSCPNQTNSEFNSLLCTEFRVGAMRPLPFHSSEHVPHTFRGFPSHRWQFCILSRRIRSIVLNSTGTKQGSWISAWRPMTMSLPPTRSSSFLASKRFMLQQSHGVENTRVVCWPCERTFELAPECVAPWIAHKRHLNLSIRLVVDNRQRKTTQDARGHVWHTCSMTKDNIPNTWAAASMTTTGTLSKSQCESRASPCNRLGGHAQESEIHSLHSTIDPTM